jgi:hypothetical protein
MDNLVNWLSDNFLLLVNLHVFFIVFFYFWNVGLSSFYHALFSCFILYQIYPYVFFILMSTCYLSSVHCPPRCALAACSLSFLLPPHTFPLLSIFPQNCIKIAKLFPKLPVQQALNTQLWLIPSHSSMFPFLPCRNEVSRGNLCYLHLFDDCGLYCCYLFCPMCGEVCKFFLCFNHCLLDLTLHSGQLSNYPHSSSCSGHSLC